MFREALAVEPDSAPVLNYLGYMNADRGVRVDGGARSSSRRRSPSTPRTAPTSTAWAGRCSASTASTRPSSILRRAVDKPSANAVVLDHLGDVLRRRGSVREAVEYWRKALKAEDDDEDLDRARVERKIREAQAQPEDAAQVKPP